MKFTSSCLVPGLLVLCSLSLGAQPDSITDEAQNLVLSLIDKVENENRIVGNIDPDSLTSLPVGIMKQIGVTRYVVAIDSAKFAAGGAWFNAYIALEFPGSGKRIAFSARHIRFNPSGVIGDDQAKLMLVSRTELDIGPNLKLFLPADGSNYVEWDCNGFKAVHLHGEFIFSGDILIPDSSQTLLKDVKASFSVHASHLDELIMDCSITPFCIRGLKGWNFSVSKAVVDFSSLRNAAGMVFPNDYPDPSVSWTGFYMKELSVTLPEELQTDAGRVTLNARNLLIDELGLTGDFLVQNVFSLGRGSMSGWEFSLDQVSVRFLCNRLSGGHLKGKIRIPAMDSAQSLNYSASVSHDIQNQRTNYVFTVSPQNGINFRAFSSQVDLYPSSRIEIKLEGNKFLPKAILNGKITFAGKNFSSPALVFQDLILSSQPPFIHAGTFATTGNGNDQPRAGKFPVSIQRFMLVTDPVHPKIFVDVKMNMMNSSDNGFTADTRVQVKARISHGTNGKQIWSLESVTIAALSLEVKTSPFYLKGVAVFRENDPVYGDGFTGNLKFLIRKVMEDTVNATACFGYKETRYWYVDAFVPVQIPLGSVPITLTGLIGGLYYHMKPSRSDMQSCISALSQNPLPGTATQFYIPDASIGLGFKAGTRFRYSGNEKTANGDVMLEVQFNSNGGLSRIELNGNMFMMSTVAERQSSGAPIYGNALIIYDADAKVFDATLNMQVNAMNAVTGQGTGKIHIDPGLWYVCVGRPTSPLNISLSGFVSAQGYFMTGSHLEPMAPVPAPVQQVVQNNGLGGLRNPGQLSSGLGFCSGFRFGSSFYKEYGWDFFSVYGGFAYGAGFDMMLKKYSTSISCPSVPPPIGLRGWLAEGQLYIYLQGNIGIKGHVNPSWCDANWCNQDFDITILSGTIAAVVEGKLPRPTWLHGELACNYNILGIVNGSLRFDFEAGRNCNLNGN